MSIGHLGNYSSLVIISLLASFVYGQEEEDSYISVVNSEVPLTINLEDEEPRVEDVDLKKKKRKRNVYYGIKTKKAFSKTGFGSGVVIETFNYIKTYQNPDPYVRDIYWYDFKARKIKKSSKVNPETGVLLHGPYIKFIGDQVLEEGIFYMGTKHGRWSKYNKKDILLDKEKYYKGWPKESIARYYDSERSKLKEIIPVEFGKKEGRFYHFYESGHVAVIGEYQNDVKVGLWREYYKGIQRRKREIRYAKNPYDKTTKPVINKEWSKAGKVIYDRIAEQAKWN